MNYGEVYWVDLPDRSGREQRGRRPAIVWQDTETMAQLPTVLIVPLTSRMDSLRFPATRQIDPTASNGLSVPSVALVFQLGACDVRRIRQQVGKLDDTDIDAIQDVTKKLLRIS